MATRYERKLELTNLFNIINGLHVTPNILFCCECDDWLFPPEIYNSGDGVHICKTCFTTMAVTPETTRNKALERHWLVFLARKFPCKYYNLGCSMVCTMETLKQHEEHCIIPPEWTEFKCCLCKFVTYEIFAMEAHYEVEHQVPTIEMENTGGYKMNLDFTEVEKEYILFLQNKLNKFIAKFKTFKSYDYNLRDVILCEPFGIIPQYNWSFDSDTNYTISTNWNQLLEVKNDTHHYSSSYPVTSLPSPLVPSRQCRNHKYGCYATGSYYDYHLKEQCSYSYEQIICCNKTLTKCDLYDHIRKNHTIIVNGSTFLMNDGTFPVYMSIDNNIFKVDEELAITWLFAFGTPYSYTCIMQCMRDEVVKTITHKISLHNRHIIFCKSDGVPECKFVRVYFFREETK